MSAFQTHVQQELAAISRVLGTGRETTRQTRSETR
jgi:hypothetical protein